MMNIIFAISKRDFRGLAELNGKKLTKFTAKFKVPYGTARKWLTGVRSVSDYGIQMMGYVMIGDIYATEEQI
jgi:hypothetical protein